MGLGVHSWCLLLAVAGCDQVFDLDSPELQCPATYTVSTSLSASRYRGSAGGLSWDAAESACLADAPMGVPPHTHLAVFADDRERLALGATFATDVWVGLDDQASEGDFVWVTDEDTKSYPPRSGGPWGTAEPDDGSGGQDCVLLGDQAGGNAGRFVDAACSEKHDYICECDGHTP